MTDKVFFDIYPSPGTILHAGQIELRCTPAFTDISVANFGENTRSGKTISADDARALRDALIEAYPLPKAAPAPRYASTSEFDGYRVRKYADSSPADYIFVTVGLTRDEAKAVADALNAKEAA